MNSKNILQLWILPINNEKKLVSNFEKNLSKNYLLKDLRSLFIQGDV